MSTRRKSGALGHSRQSPYFASLLRRGDPYGRVVVPDHKRLRPGTLRQILNEAGVNVEQLLKLR
ncbi:MAG: type II toxin-antitoxin system HicA family toxin [Bryobacteraceae bacterium]